MKKTKLFLAVLIGFVFGALAAAGVYFLTVGEVAWNEYVETKLIPNAVLALTAIGGLATAALPIIARVQCAIDKFNKATQDVNDTVEKGRKTEGALCEQDKRISKFDERFNALEQKLDDKLMPIEKDTKTTKEICKIGFCNMSELVQNGYAAEIAKVEADDEHEETES